MVPPDAIDNFFDKVLEGVTCWLAFLFSVFVLLLLQRKLRHSRKGDSSHSSTSRCRRFLCILSSEDAFFASSSFPPWTRSLISGICMVFWIMTALYVTIFLLGVLLYAVERWEGPKKGFVFLLYSAGLAADDLAEAEFDSDAGKWFCFFMAIWVLIAKNLVLGLSGCLQIISRISKWMPPSSLGFYFWLIVVIPLLLALVICILAVFMSFIESWAYTDALFWVCEAITGDYGLADDDVDSLNDTGRFFMSMCYLISYVLSGAVVIMVYVHPSRIALCHWLEGCDSDKSIEKASPANSELQTQSNTLQVQLNEALARAEAAEARAEAAEAKLANVSEGETEMV